MVFEKIRAIICEQTKKDENAVTLETRFREDLDADSLELFQIVNDIEDEFDVRIDDLEKVITVADAVRLVEASLG